MNDLRTTGQVIDILGGYKGVGKLTGADLNAMYNWRSQGKFPSWTYLAITDALRARKLAAPDRLWPRMKVPRGKRVAAE